MFSHISVKTDLRVQRNSRIKGRKFRTLLVRSKRACTWVRDSQGDQKRRKGLWVTSLSCQDLPQCTHHHQRHQDTITHSFFHSAPPLCTHVFTLTVCVCVNVWGIFVYIHMCGRLLTDIRYLPQLLSTLFHETVYPTEPEDSHSAELVHPRILQSPPFHLVVLTQVLMLQQQHIC